MSIKDNKHKHVDLGGGAIAAGEGPVPAVLYDKDGNTSESESNVSLQGSVSVLNNTTDSTNENRPLNGTYQIWRRTA